MNSMRNLKTNCYKQEMHTQASIWYSNKHKVKRERERVKGSSANNKICFEVRAPSSVGPKAYHPSFDDDQLMKLCLLMILCLISDRFIIKILVGA